MKLSRQAGFTLIEILVVVVIVSILATMAYPSYTNHIVSTRRATAQGFIIKLAANQEKFFTQCGIYASGFNGTGTNSCPAGGGPGTLGLSATDADIANNYTVAITLTGTPVGSTYSVVLTPIGMQATRDTNCVNLTYDSRGMKGVTGPDAGNNCWKK